jgi:hypothetical protein
MFEFGMSLAILDKEAKIKRSKTAWKSGMARDESCLVRAMYATKRLKQFAHCRIDYSVYFAKLCDKVIACKKEIFEVGFLWDASPGVAPQN